MSSTWRTEITAVLRKEWITELRSKSGIVTGLLFSVVTVYAISLGPMQSLTKADAHPNGTVSASMLWVALLFAAATTLPRSFLAEEEHGTADLLRLTARPHAVFWGKSIFNAIQTVITGVLLSFLYLGFTSSPIQVPWLFAVSLVAGCLSLASAVTLCGAIAAQAANRAVLSAAVAVPLLLPLVALGVSGMRVSLGEGLLDGGRAAALGLIGYAVATMATGPWIFAAVWKS